jgi:AcrR family transcriptional regulator
LLQLIDEGDLRPTAPRIAEQAGVSLRSVFQHFSDLEALFAAAAARELERLSPLVGPLPVGAPLDVRLDAFVTQRARVLEAITPVRRASLLQEPSSPELRSSRARLLALARGEVAQVFDAELTRRPRVDRVELADVGGLACPPGSFANACASRHAAHALRPSRGKELTVSDASTDDARNALAELVVGHSDDEITKAAEELGVDTLLDQVFGGMEQAFQPEKAAGQSAVVQWDVDAPDGKHSRTVHIADGTCKVEPGAAESPRLTLTLTLPDFLRFVAGQLDGMQAFMSGKLKLGGDIMLAQTMQAWFAT